MAGFSRHTKQQDFTKDTFRRYLMVELVAFCPMDEIALDVCRVISGRLAADVVLTSAQMLDLVGDAKTIIIERLLASDSWRSRFMQLFDRQTVLPLANKENHWKAVGVALSSLGSPCEYLLIDYYIRGRDQAVVVNHWTERVNCTRKFRQLLKENLALP